MQMNGNVLTVGLGLTIEEIREFEQFVRSRLEDIARIEVEEGTLLQSSALIALFVTLKHARPEISIPFLDQKKIVSPVCGTLHWVCHD